MNLKARSWRIEYEYEGALYNVLSRGNVGQDIVICYDDHKLYGLAVRIG